MYCVHVRIANPLFLAYVIYDATKNTRTLMSFNSAMHPTAPQHACMAAYTCIVNLARHQQCSGNVANEK